MRALAILLLLALTCANTALGENTIEAQLARVVTETKKNLPMPINESIQATDIGAEGKTLVNYYNFTKQRSDFYDLQSVIDNYRRNSINIACSNPATKSFIVKKGGAIEYRFYDSENVFIEKFTIDYQTCRAH